MRRGEGPDVCSYVVEGQKVPRVGRRRLGRDVDPPLLLPLPTDHPRNGYRWSVGGLKVSLMVRGLTQRIRLR